MVRSIDEKSLASLSYCCGPPKNHPDSSSAVSMMYLSEADLKALLVLGVSMHSGSPFQVLTTLFVKK